MLTRTRLIAQGQQATQGLSAWAEFVAQSEFLWQDATLVSDPAAWQRQWFELEIVNALALDEWDQHGRPEDWSQRWHEGYRQEAQALVDELLRLVNAA